MATETIHKTGEKPITFEKNGLHKSLNIPAGEKIPAAKKEAALRGAYGPAAKKKALFAKNVLTR
mgnify:CR=1 FL=1